MLATIEMIKEKFGGVEGYLKGRCGFGEGDLEIFAMLGGCRPQILEEVTSGVNLTS